MIRNNVKLSRSAGQAKKIVLLAVFFLATLSMFGQDITGKWNGVLSVQGTTLRVDFNLSKTADGYSSTMDSPDQGALGIKTTTTEFKDKTLTITVTDLGIEYVATLNEDNVFDGKFTQMGQAFDMDLTKEKKE